MDTTMEMPAAAADMERFLRHLGKPARWTAPRLAKAADEIRGYIHQQPDITLGEIGAALVGASFTWSSDGKLAYAPQQVALIDEVEALIEMHGQGTRAAALFL